MDSQSHFRQGKGIELKLWKLWAKALGPKASTDDGEADAVALIRSVIVLAYLVTNAVIVAGVFRHWND